ncbi:MAG: hypothetical protein Kow001_03530 [Acidobacteriota bacterium]
MQGKTYDLRSGEGLRIWEACQAVAAELRLWRRQQTEEVARYGEPMLVQPRLGQGIFRVNVIEAYQRACAVSREHSLPALEAAHIRPFAEGGEHRVSNGLLLRSDIHRLFDQGYVTVTPDYRFLVSDRLRQDFANGRSYEPFKGTRIAVPRDPRDRPDPQLLGWHNSERFLG